MSKVPVTDEINKGKDEEKQYEWLRATDHYRKALNAVVDSDLLKKIEIKERLAYAVYKSAFQAENSQQFEERIKNALNCYGEAKKLCETSMETGMAARRSRCDAMIAYASYWLTPKVSEKKRLLDECWKLAKDALRAFKEAGDGLEYGKTYNQLSASADSSLAFKEDFRLRETTLKKLVEHGEQAIKFLLACRDLYELTKAYVYTGNYLVALGDARARERYHPKARDYCHKANDLSEQVIFLEVSSREEVNRSLVAMDWIWGTDEAQKNYEKLLTYARRTRDKFKIGSVLGTLVHQAAWRALRAEDPNERTRSFDKALEYAKHSKRQFSTISYVSPFAFIFWVEAPYAEYYSTLAKEETDFSERQRLLQKAMDATPDLLYKAKKSGIPLGAFYANHVVSNILARQAMIELDSEDKRVCLQNSLKHRNEAIKYIDRNNPFDYYNRGISWLNLAQTRSELAKLATNLETRKNILQEATADAERGLKLCIQGLASEEKGGIVPSARSFVSSYQCEYGNLLKRLYDITHSNEYLTKAIKAFEDSTESAQKLHLNSRVAESNWKIAQTYNALGKHLKAAESFTLASNNYKSAAEKIPQLKDLYQDLSRYMQAWCEIEKARHYHGKQEYDSARERYENAATLYKSLKEWSYLAANYSAWASVEKAEDLSRKEESEDAIHAFEQAAKLFNESRKVLKTELDKIENADEKQMVTRIIDATGTRYEYCIARITLEEAKTLDKKGDHFASSEKYGSAAETFKKLSQKVESEQEKKEFKLIISLSLAWQKMTRAEAEASPKLYLEASRLFEKAKEFGPSERTKMLTLGHSHFCRALEAGIRFIDTRDATLHDVVARHLGSAEDYYIKAGYQKASEYAKATKLFFDAYIHMGNADRETDPEKKARLYAMTEKVLQTSAGSFLKAEHPAKREQILALLDKVKEERELAISLSEILHAPAVVSATTVFSAPTPTYEEAVGLDRFEHAQIAANLIISPKELSVGESTELEIELVNVGKGQALLSSIENAIPTGFKLAVKPEFFRIIGYNINMRGRRLDPLKAETVRLCLKSRRRGSFVIRPTIQYLDENGIPKSHQPEPVIIAVKEAESKKVSLDKEYLATARSLAKLEELRALGTISEKTYQKLKREYERKLSLANKE